MTPKKPLTASASRRKPGRLPVNFGEIADLIRPFLRLLALWLPNSCWIWTLDCTADGYGYLESDGGGRIYVHRLSYQLFVGPIPIDREVLHAKDCLGRACFNFRHLRLGTHAENEREKRV